MNTLVFNFQNMMNMLKEYAYQISNSIALKKFTRIYKPPITKLTWQNPKVQSSLWGNWTPILWSQLEKKCKHAWRRVIKLL
jgi:hypothetical protein